MLTVSQWVLDYRRRAPPRPPKKSTARTVSIDEWQRIEQLLETESVSLFMRMYNWLNDYAEKVGADSDTAASIESLIQDGFDVVRSEKPVSTSSQAASIFHWTEKKYRRRRLSYIHNPQLDHVCEFHGRLGGVARMSLIASSSTMHSLNRLARAMVHMSQRVPTDDAAKEFKLNQLRKSITGTHITQRPIQPEHRSGNITGHLLGMSTADDSHWH